MPVSVLPVEPKHLLGENIAEMRLGLGLTQEELAHACGLHPVEISRFERGVRDPRLSTIVKIANGLGVPAMDLLRGL